MKQIPLNGKHGKGKFALVDDDDYEELMQYKWNSNPDGYAIRGVRIDGDYINIKMHRVIINCNKGLFVDHINHNKLDNRKDNLRACTLRQNAMNSIPRNSCSSIYKGVSFHKVNKKWVAYININMKYTYLGSFNTELEAAKAYNISALKHFEQFAHLNKI
jgi:hypothetical protein